ncbi:MAG TPA: hypothetical protein VN493_24405 [Thermoanaerobaculia bacterium]|nr:hypothetical protein [Thermoanaerobaculia bacterium]
MEPDEQPSAQWSGLVREHPGLLLTAAYVLLTLTGLSYEFWLFRYFRITIVEYVETSDFLLAVLREPLVILLAFLPLLLVWFFIRLGAWMRVKFPRYAEWERKREGKPYNSPAFRTAQWSFFVLVYAFLFIQIYAERVADRIKAGQGRQVQVELVSGTALPPTSLLLGTTAKFVFVYLPVEKKTHIIPIENVSRMVISSGKRSEERR